MILALTEKQKECIEYLANGENISDIAIKLKVSRQAIHYWKKNEEFKAELDACLTRIKTDIRDNISVNSNKIVDKILKIALNSKNEKTSLDACTYLLDHVLGKSTSKIADVSNQEKNDIINLDVELKELEKVIDFTNIKAK